MSPRVLVIASVLLALSLSCAQRAVPTGGDVSGASLIAGVVLDAGGRPVPGALVAAVDVRAWEIVRTAHSGQDGGFRFTDLVPGRYTVTATADSRPAARSGPIDLPPGRARDSRRLRMSGDGFTVQGIVRTSGGQPLDSVRIEAQRWGGEEGDLYAVQVSDAGLFRVVLSGRRYHGLWAVAPNGASTPVYVTGDRDETLEIELEPKHPEDTPAPPTVLDWLRTEAIALRSVDAGGDLADMRPLAGVVGDARIVGLGEATHGTSEFFRLKHRVLEFLAREAGFRLFAIEADFSAALAVDDYVQGGKGSPARAVAGLGFPWDTDEVRDLVVWMRGYNESVEPSRRLRFFGFDMRSVTGSALALDSHLERPDGVSLSTRLRQGGDLNANQIDDALAAVDRAVRLLNERRAPGREIARQHARVVRQNLERRRADLVPGHGRIRVRDRSMAENALALLDIGGPDSRMVLWAHNGHVSRDSLPSGIRSMGAHLADNLGRRYVAVGMSFDRGGLRAIGRTSRAVDSFEVGRAPTGSLDAALAAAGQPILAIDLRRAPAAGSVRDWFETRLLTRHVGATFNESDPRVHLTSRAPLRHFDVLLFVAATSAARSLSDD